MHVSDRFVSMLYIGLGLLILFVTLTPWITNLLFIAAGFWLLNRGCVMQGKPSLFVLGMRYWQRYNRFY